MTDKSAKISMSFMLTLDFPLPEPPVTPITIGRFDILFSPHSILILFRLMIGLILDRYSY